MKHILAFTLTALLGGLTLGQTQAQTKTGEPATSTVAPRPENPVQPIPKPDRNTRTETVSPTPASSPDPYFYRPVEPSQHQVDRLYQNRMEVDNYAPANQPESIVGPPPSSMQPQQAPGRTGTIGGTGNQGNVGGSTNQNSQRNP